MRYVGAAKSDFGTIENFFYSLIKLENNMIASYVGKPEWKDSVNFMLWIDKLTIEKLSNDSFQNEFNDAFTE